MQNAIAVTDAPSRPDKKTASQAFGDFFRRVWTSKTANDSSGDESSSGTKRQTDKMTRAIRPLWRSNGHGQITGVCQALILIVVICVFMRRVQDAAGVEAVSCLVCV